MCFVTLDLIGGNTAWTSGSDRNYEGAWAWYSGFSKWSYTKWYRGSNLIFQIFFTIPFIKMDSTNIERRYGVLTGSTAKDQPTFYTTSKHYAGVVVATTFCYKLLYNKVGLLHVV